MQSPGLARLMPLAAALALIALAAVSIFVGVNRISPLDVLKGGVDADALNVLLVSRVPRTLALLLAGAGLSIAGLLMQMLVRNRFVEPSTVGTMEAATFGMLLVTLFAPDTPVFGKMLVASASALAGTMLFLRILAAVPLRSVLMVPLIGILFSGVIGAVTTFFAYRYDLLQSLGAWTTGDFSVVLRGRYELLWASAVLAIVAYIAADRFTIVGLGRDFATNLGLAYRSAMAIGLVIISLVSAAVVVTVGIIPFLGLIVPNLVSIFVGDNVRKSLPFVAMLGAGLVVACDIVGRLVIYPFEVPIGTTMGIVGSAIFLTLLLRGGARVS